MRHGNCHLSYLLIKHLKMDGKKYQICVSVIKSCKMELKTQPMEPMYVVGVEGEIFWAMLIFKIYAV